MANKGLLGTTSKQSYYSQEQTTWAQAIDGTVLTYGVTTVYFPTRPTQQADIAVFIDGIEIKKNTYSYNHTSPGDTDVDNNYNIVFHNTNGVNSDVQAATGAPLTGKTLLFKEIANTEKFGTYRYVALNDIVNNFMIGYVGNGKLIKNTQRSDILFYARRGIQEFAYDVSRVEKIQEIDISASLKVPMPQDYINYVKIAWIDSSGIEHLIMPARYTSKPSESILQDTSYDYIYDNDGDTLKGNSVEDTNFKTSTASNLNNSVSDDYYYNSEYNTDRILNKGGRYGLEPEFATNSGVFIIDEANGTINFSSDLKDRTVIIKYISDGVGTDSEMQVHKFAEEAMYKHIAFSVLSTKENIPEYVVTRYRKERRAALRNAKIRLSNIKIEELTQVMRGKSKHIKS
mgnify:CR=1 FL=1